MANPRVVAMLKKKKWKIVAYKGFHYVVPKWWTWNDFANGLELVEDNMKM